MARCLLIHPATDVAERIYTPWLPLALVTMATLPRQNGVDVQIVDMRLPGAQNHLAHALEKPVDLVGISTMTSGQILGGIAAAKVVRKLAPGAPIVWGGIHPSILPEETLAHPLVDLVVVGEGERPLVRLIEIITKGGALDDVPGLGFQEDGVYKQNAPASPLDLDQLPEPDYSLIDHKAYLHRMLGFENVADLETSRGCSFGCKYCYNRVYRNGWRGMGPQSAVKRFLGLSALGVSNFYLIDDNLTDQPDRALEIFSRLAVDLPNINIGAQGIRVDRMEKFTDKEIESLVRGGLRWIHFGVESGAHAVQKKIGKVLSPERVIALNQRLNQFPEIYPHYNFICGFPGETIEDLYQSADLALQIVQTNPRATISPFHHYKPYPGTPLEPEAIAAGYKRPDGLENWGRYEWSSPEPWAGDGTRKFGRLSHRVEVASIFVDDKVALMGQSGILSALARAYRPVARFRMRHRIYSPMPEARLIFNRR